MEQLEALVGRDQNEQNTFAAEDQERTAYRQELDKMRDYVAMGEGI